MHLPCARSRKSAGTQAAREEGREGDMSGGRTQVQDAEDDRNDRDGGHTFSKVSALLYLL